MHKNCSLTCAVIALFLSHLSLQLPILSKPLVSGKSFVFGLGLEFCRK